ncbi:hypothetical protein [Snuella sedimenti]|uniref:Uncharacterized protein n=1 Tax=Snuella sedimenti TaxID=2798802 RepID=A0A8J7ITM5_9FLAO|nr:hypothetical protein [Snuella sedimenti]MBJ6367775.1 hypothetical protein [Snuella sedimenti]
MKKPKKNKTSMLIKTVKWNFYALAFCVALSTISCSEKEIVLGTESFQIRIDKKGNLQSLKDISNGTEFLKKDQIAPLLAIRDLSDTINQLPLSADFNKKAETISLNFKSGAKIDIAFREKEHYLTFEVVSITPQEKVPAIVWGSYPVNIEGIVGEVVGVARNENFAIGLQALNIKTTGGELTNNVGEVENRKGAATKTDFGCTLNAFTIDRSVERTANVWANHFKNMPVKPIEGETVVGSKIALFGCAPEQVLETIGTIEETEGLPHPKVDGQWIKTHPERSKAYLITTFTEDNFDELLEYTKKAGMNAIYHAHPFKNWGAFNLIPDQFPNGRVGMKTLVEKANTQGVRVGVHTLTTFTTPNDPFVTPVPNNGLVFTGQGTLTGDIDATSTEILVSTNEYFNNEEFNWMHTVKVGDELIRYRTVSKDAPYKLLDCERGTFGTKSSEHQKGDVVGKLLDHPYKVFFPDFELQKEMAQNMIDFFNETGITQMDFDGHEGALATGQGTYSMDDFAKRVFEGTQQNLVNGSSRTTHYYWHINHYINWGEPWYGGFRQSQSEYRFNNQPFLEANYLPNMLGWFSLTPHTTIADIEWMLARGAAYNAGFALSANPNALSNNPNTDTILNLIRIWEKARLSGAFSEEQKQQLKDLSKEFHLEETIRDKEWKLMMFQDYDFVFEKVEVQPGQPTYAEWKYTNETGEQPFKAFITLDGQKDAVVSDITIEVSNHASISIPEKLEQGQELILENNKLVISDAKGKLIKERNIVLPIHGKGGHSIQFDCKIQNGDPKVKVKIRLDGKEENITARL